MLTRLVLIAAALAALAEAYSDTPYCRQYCLREEACAASAGFKHGVTEEEKQTIVDTHNLLRSKLAKGGQIASNYSLPSAANMRKLSWSDELAENAQQQANICTFGTDCGQCLKKSTSFERHGIDWSVGHNVLMSMHSVQAESVDWKGAVHDWYGEVKYFSHWMLEQYNGNIQLFPVIDHFVQMVWADTYKVGCGFIMFRGVYWFNKVYVCNYALSDEVPIYKIGEPCSQCPNGTTCNEDSLCA